MVTLAALAGIILLGFANSAVEFVVTFDASIVISKQHKKLNETNNILCVDVGALKTNTSCTIDDERTNKKNRCSQPNWLFLFY